MISKGFVLERKKTLEKKLKKFGFDKEYIEEEDITQIFEKMNVTIDNDETTKIFQDLDVENTGKVKIEKFVEAVTLSQKASSTHTGVLKKINDELTTKSERIIIKLKNLKNRATFCSDSQSLDDIDW
jgi:Ca2+-binding EF-hand superfamily protein